MPVRDQRAEVDQRLTEERLALLSVLQELTVAALDLFDAQKSPDGFLDRLAERLGCVVAALCLEIDPDGAIRLQSAAGLSRASREIPIPERVAGPADLGRDDLPLPYPELARPGLVRWAFPIVDDGCAAYESPCHVLLLFFDGEPRLPRQYRGMVLRLTEVLRTVLHHRRLFTRTRESERRLHEQKTLLMCQSEASIDGILVVSREGTVLLSNRRFAEMWGVERALESGSYEILLHALAEKVTSPEQLLAQFGSPFEQEAEVTQGELSLKDHRAFHCYSAPIRSADGVDYGVGLYFRDITARRSAERELKRERDFSSAVVDTVGALVVVLNRQGQIVRFNRACQRVTGYSFEEVRGTALWELLLLPEDMEAMRQVFAQLRDRVASSQYENVWVTKDGRCRRIAWSNTVLLGDDGEVEYLIGTGIDVTEQRWAEAERDRFLEREQVARARAEEQKRRSAFIAEVSGILADSLDYEVTLASVGRLAVPQLADWCIIDLIEQDQSLHRLPVAHADPSQVERAREVSRALPDLGDTHGPGKVLRTGEAELFPDATRGTAEAQGVEGQRAWDVDLPAFGSYICVPLVARGRTLGALTFGVSAPGRPYGPAELELAQEIARRAALAVDNARLYRAAQEAVEVRDEFLSIASHELKTPVTSMLLAVQRTLHIANLGSLSSQTVLRSLQTIERQCKRLGKLVDDLLDVSRIHMGRLDLELEEVDLVGLSREIAARFSAELAASGSSLSLRAGPQATGWWDRSRVDQIVTNLLSNAIKYGAGKPIEVEITTDADVARFVVRDHGLGIPPDRVAQIFRPFERAVSSRYYGGLGLGLHIVRQIVERLGGSIRVESELGVGSTFTVELPRSGPPAVPVGPTPTWTPQRV